MPGSSLHATLVVVEVDSLEREGQARVINVALPAFGLMLLTAFRDRGLQVTELLELAVNGSANGLGAAVPGNMLGAVRGALPGPSGDRQAGSPIGLVGQLLQTMACDERSLVEAGVKRFGELSAREREVACLWAASHTTMSIADKLGIESRTVENYNSHIYRKLGLDLAPPHLRKSTLLAKVTMIHALIG